MIDELHSLRGVYGSHVANILRRLRRLCEFYGSRPQFICSSATIGNPKELAEGLTEREMTLVDESGAPRGERYFAIYNPPVVNRQLGIRKSALNSARDVSLSFLGKGLQTIVFAPVAARDRGARDVPQGGARDEAGLGGRHPRLPRRLPAAEAPRDRAGAARGLGARRRLDERARARDRHRQPRRGGAGRLPGQRRLGLAAGGPRGAALGHLGRGAGRELDAAQPVHREEPRLLLRRAGRAGPHQPRQPADPGQPREVRGLRAAVRGRRAVRQGEPGRDPEVPRGARSCCTGRGSAGTGRATATRPTRSACARSPRTTS